MAIQWLRTGLAALAMLTLAGCATKQAQVPPAAPQPAPAQAPEPKKSLIVLLPEADGKATAITVTNPGGAQTLDQPYQATRVERSDAAPGSPFAIEQAEVRRVFGAVLDALPTPAASFTLFFGEGRDALRPDEQAVIAEVLKAIQDRRSTAIHVIGHTDTTANSRFNQRLGMRRAQGVANILRQRGVDRAAIFVDSHGDADLAVKTERNVAERRNRRVEVIVE